MGGPTNADGRMGAGFSNQINNGPDCADNVWQQLAKRQLVTDRHDFTSMGPNMTNHSLGWSHDDAVGPRILYFGNKGAGDAAQMWRNENNNSRVNPDSIPAVETRWKGGLVAEAKSTLNLGQNLNIPNFYTPLRFQWIMVPIQLYYSGKREGNNQVSSFRL
jgi:hypothetical protein